jgi:hypothetical protein
MAYFDENASAQRFEPSSTVEQSLERFINLFEGLANSEVIGDRLRGMFLFATEGPDVRLAAVVDCEICGLRTYEVLDAPIFTSANIEQIHEIVRVTDKYQAKLTEVGITAVFYCSKPAPRTDNQIHPFDAARELLAYYWNSFVAKANSEKFLQLF